MKLWSHYHVPQSVDEALALLTHYEGRAQVIAGGTDLLIDLQQNNHPPVEALIDITRIQALQTIDMSASHALIGAGVTHTQIVAQPTLRSRATCLAESCGVVGGPQVRNVATLGGNVVHALPAADGTLSLVALRAEAEVATSTGRETLPVEALYLGPGKSRVDPKRDLLIGFRVPLAAPGEGSAFERIMRPQGVALPILGCAVWVKLDATGDTFEDVSICAGPVGPTPKHAQDVAERLIGQPAHEDSIYAAAEAARRLLLPRTSKYRATADYRTEMIELLVHRALHTALIRARTGEAIPEGVG